MTSLLTPFQCHISDEVIADLKARLQRTRLPDQLEGAGWDYGTELTYLDELCTYWRDEFDWRAAEARFNRFPQFTTQINDENVHFYHIRSPEPHALPLIITHGYPGSIAEFLDILGPLSDPASHGGDRRDAFHVVAPSIPGFGFSGPTRNKGFNIGKAAAVNTQIMEMLGYDRYVVQGGDFGSAISGAMAIDHPERVIALHLNFILGRPADPANPMAGLSDGEIAEQEWKRNYDLHESGYQAIQGTKPQSLAYGLTDSPAGLAAWIVEKFKTWSDCGGDIERSFSKDHLLENIMLYWVTGTINSAMRLYYESIGPGRAPAGGWPRIDVPTAHARFPAEIRPIPRAWAEQMYNIVRWTKQPKGGHFAAFEQPGLFLDDLREFCRDYR
ncbi:epoxide hydrolase 1 [Novosphingobium sp. G106]|uniref:epoxide hydrolase family protein n=1 Tax=Novosphingobium sp. G106 TaxID=2849500 RepID=UPI001C2D63CD|nr:epoxide hydrolase family protein [Novosphingobium sp. G106]MBV1687856.1 epoxide hydrolase 1 [Novosphingobium sp. G106]